MATQNRSGGAGAVGNSFHQVAQGLARVQEALHLQEQEAQRRLQEALRLQEERSAAALRQMEQQLQERDNVISALRRSLDERVLRVEVRVAAVEERVRSSSARTESEGARGQVELQEHDYAARTRQIEPVEETMRPSSERRESEGAAEQGALERLEGRMGKLEESVQRALATVFPRVEALVERLETSPPGAPLSPTAASASTSSAPQPAAARVAPGASVAEEEAAVVRHRRRHRRRREWVALDRRVKEVERRMLISRAAPSDLGEALCKATRVDEVRGLLDSGADVNYTSANGKCPLISAIALLSGGHSRKDVLGTVSLLLARGADANSIDLDGMSALHLAINGRVTENDEEFSDDDSFGDFSVDYFRRFMGLLIDAGADLNARNFDGATPLDLAADNELELYSNSLARISNSLAAENNDEMAILSLRYAGANNCLSGWSGVYKAKKPIDIAVRASVMKCLYYYEGRDCK